MCYDAQWKKTETTRESMTSLGRYICKERIILFKLLSKGGTYEIKAMADAFGHDDPMDTKDVCEIDAIELLTDIVLDEVIHATDEQIEKVCQHLRDEAYLDL